MFACVMSIGPIFPIPPIETFILRAMAPGVWGGYVLELCTRGDAIKGFALPREFEEGLPGRIFSKAWDIS
jgi:hypothetical protein